MSLSDRALDVVRALSSDAWTSGAELGDRLQITRAAIWKQIEALRAMGVGVESERGRGYRLTQPLDWLDAARIRASLRTSRVIVDVVAETDSTNAALWREPPSSGLRVLLAEAQTAGRGRRGRAWQSPPGGGLWLSMRARLQRPLPQMSGLALAVGCIAEQTLTSAGYTGIGLKWPNDLVVGSAKLGGILIEIRGEIDGPTDVVVGLGLNVVLSRAVQDAIAQPSIALCELTDGSVDRNRLAAQLIDALADGLSVFERDGLDPFRTRWAQVDVLAGQTVRVLREADDDQIGIARGVDDAGCLQLETAAGVMTVADGEISVRRHR